MSLKRNHGSTVAIWLMEYRLLSRVFLLLPKKLGQNTGALHRKCWGVYILRFAAGGAAESGGEKSDGDFARFPPPPPRFSLPGGNRMH